MHSLTPMTEPDVGTAAASGYNLQLGQNTISARNAGPLEVSETTYSAGYSGGSYQDRSNGFGTGDFGGVGTSGSIVFFVKATDVSNGQVISSHPDNAAFIVWVLSDGRLQFQTIHGSDSRTINSVPNSLRDGNWHMVALTCDGTNANRMFFDGEEVSYTTSTTGTGLTSHTWLSDSVGSVGTLRIGQDTRYGSPSPIDAPFIGNLSELMFFAGAVSPANVFSLYEASQPVVPPVPGAGGHRHRGRRTAAF